MTQLPETFCWTKIGPEAGEGVATIRLRKEWERRLGDGRFFWGVGQSLGASPSLADAAGTGLRVLFSPMPSKAKAIDSAPEGVLLWNAWIDAMGHSHRLPAYCFITSRSHLPSGRAKEHHYALVCASDQELIEDANCFVTPGCLRNAGSNRVLGASQVTAVVRVAESSRGEAGLGRYPISFVAELRPPYVLRLSDPTTLNTTDLVEVRAVCASKDMDAWRALVLRLRARASHMSPPVQRGLDFTSIASDARSRVGN